MCVLVVLVTLYLLQSPEFWKMVVNVVHALLLMGSWQAIQGLGVWVGRLVGATPPFITAAEEQAKSSYEAACEEYLKALELLQASSANEKDHTHKSILAIKIQFIVNRVSLCRNGLTCAPRSSCLPAIDDL